METYRVRVSKDYLSFCSAHFIVFHGSQCERLHGHNYRVAAELEAELDDDSLVFDFIALKRILRELTGELDHRLLVPVEARKLAVEVGDDEVTITYRDKRWLAPRGDCALLPIANTTAELLARYFADRLASTIAEQFPTRLARMVIEVEESPGQCAFYERVY